MSSFRESRCELFLSLIKSSKDLRGYGGLEVDEKLDKIVSAIVRRNFQVAYRLAYEIVRTRDIPRDLARRHLFDVDNFAGFNENQ